ncbi:30S ribosomal protein S17 [bacterium]|nr:30S ribosomal protein S17 [bacterium]
MNKNKEKEAVKQQKGTVTSVAGDKTIVVEVVTLKTHKKYVKKYKSSKKYSVHDEKSEYVIGDVVYFKECHPISKNKKWTVTGKVEVK